MNLFKFSLIAVSVADIHRVPRNDALNRTRGRSRRAGSTPDAVYSKVGSPNAWHSPVRHKSNVAIATLRVTNS